MPADKVLGLHIIGDTGGSNENAVAFARQLGGKYATVVNSDWKLVQPLLNSGIEVIARVKNKDWNDDDADNHQSGKEWAQYLHNVYPDTRTILTAGNELGDATPERTQAWMVEFIEAAARLGHRTAGYHSHFLSPYRGYWATQTRAFDALRANDGRVCVHKGFAAKWKDVPDLRGQTAIDEDFSRILEILAYDVPVVVTEFTGSKQPDRGWEFLYKDAAGTIRVDWALAEAKLGLKWLADYGVYATYFTWWKWHNGEGFELAGDEDHKKDFRAGLIDINFTTTVKERPMQTYPAPTSGGVRARLTTVPGKLINVRAQPNPNDALTNNSTDLGDLLVGDEVIWYPNDAIGDWVHVEPVVQVQRDVNAKQQPAAKGWVSRQKGAVQFTMLDAPQEPMITIPVATYNKMYTALSLAAEVFEELAPRSSGGNF